MLSKGSRKLVAYFVRSYPGRSAVLVGMLVLAGLSEALGVATLLPLLDTVSGASEGSAAAAAVQRVLEIAGAPPSLATLLMLIVAAMVLKAGFRLLAMQQVGYTVAHVATDLRLHLLRALSSTSWSYFVQQPVGRFANAVSAEISTVAASYRAACALFAGLVQVLVYTGIAMMVSWQVAVLALLSGAAIVLVLSRVIEMSREAGHRQTQALRSLTSRLTDALSGIKAIKAMGREHHMQPLLEHETDALRRAQQKQVVAGEVLNSAQEPILALLLAVGIYFGVRTFELPIGYVFMLGFLFYRLAGRISIMQAEYQGIAWGEAAFESLQEITEGALRARENTSGKVPPSLEHGITFHAVEFGYDNKAVLQSASLDIRAGEFVTIIGQSGAGKTTAVDLMVGFFRPGRGSVRVDGTDLGELDLRAWRQFVGYVPQETFLFHDTVRENVTLGDPAIGDEDVLSALRLAGAEGFVSALPDGIGTDLGERGARLSGGQRQRIGLARALVRRPSLLILDEVTSALDAETEREVCETLRALAGTVTIVAISHRPGFVHGADRVLRLDNGVFKAVGITETEHLVGAYSQGAGA